MSIEQHHSFPPGEPGKWSQGPVFTIRHRYCRQEPLPANEHSQSSDWEVVMVLLFSLPRDARWAHYGVIVSFTRPCRILHRGNRKPIKMSPTSYRFLYVLVNRWKGTKCIVTPVHLSNRARVPAFSTGRSPSATRCHVCPISAILKKQSYRKQLNQRSTFSPPQSILCTYHNDRVTLCKTSVKMATIPILVQARGGIKWTTFRSSLSTVHIFHLKIVQILQSQSALPGWFLLRIFVTTEDYRKT